MSLTAKQLSDVAWALDALTKVSRSLLEPIAAAADFTGAALTEVTVELTMRGEPITPKDARTLLEWLDGDEMQRDLRDEAARRSRRSDTLKAMMPDDKATLEIAMNGFERIKTSDLTMDGYTTFHGRLSMNEVVAMNRLFEIVAELPEDGGEEE